MEIFIDDSNESNGRLSAASRTSSVVNDKKWEWGILRNQCRNLELEQFYQSYMQRLRVSYLLLFIVIEFLVVAVHSIILLATIPNISNISTDIYIYIVAVVFVWCVLALNFNVELIKRFSFLMYVTSWLAVSILVVTDIGISVYHAVIKLDLLRPVYGSYILYAVYIFMPLPNNVHAIILGIAVSLSYLVNYAFVTYRKHTTNDIHGADFMKLITEAIFLVSINLLGTYYRMMKEIAVRTTFIDRRQYMEENLMLRFARDEEKNLWLSIIPSEIADKIEQDVKARVERIRAKKKLEKLAATITSVTIHPNVEIPVVPVKRWRQPDIEKLFIEPHDDVTILYADVVNYTYLTTTLDVKTLVETLHDLFVKFDLASEENNVLRIKFLGDCYYCVAGVPLPNENHAKCCVNLGLRMINVIRDVRTQRNLMVDMRIGVHSGSILSGVIGACKWQYDVWSKDVDIANRLEQTGASGRVHVSEDTLRQLDGEYMYEEGTSKARRDPVLRKFGIRTFLIKGQRFLESSNSEGNSTNEQIDDSYRTETAKNFMRNNIEQFNQIRTQAKLEMSRELDKMPIGRIELRKFWCNQNQRLTLDEMEEQNIRRNITSLFLFFKDWRWEKQFLMEPDDMLKYSVLMGLIIFAAILSIQSINKAQTIHFWIANTIYLSLLIVILFLTWFKKMWIMYLANREKSINDEHHILLNLLYKSSKHIESNVLIRTVIYIMIIFICFITAILQLTDCDLKLLYDDDYNDNDDGIDFISSELSFDINEMCENGFNPWATTSSIELTMCMVFLFSRIPFLVKLITGIVISVVYSLIIFARYSMIYESSPSSNVHLQAKYSHILVIIITLVIFHLMDRQSEFIAKVDYNWKRQLQKKQEDAVVTNESISVLINNILPSHVADIYISKEMKNELYYEEYDNVAVMFASIRNFDKENVGLRVLNEIICDFDNVLKQFDSEGIFKVEKIKVAGWTYMAACGLDLSRSESVNTQNTFRNSSILPNGRRSHYHSNISNSQMQPGRIKRRNSRESMKRSQSYSQYEGHNIGLQSTNRKISSPQQNNVVYVMAQFALHLMRVMHSFTVENLQCEDANLDHGMLRIGISNGKTMAGIVGSSKPHYDIWGNAVNMASRMDSTGIPGRIQVTQETAEILRAYNIQCNFRGMTYVKGRGEIPTYFIGIDENFNFIPDSCPF